MLRRFALLAPAVLLLATPALGQATADGPTGRAGTGATLGAGAVRPLADPSVPCRHGAAGLPGGGTVSCPAGKAEPALAADPPHPPPFTGGVFGPEGRGPDKRPQS